MSLELINTLGTITTVAIVAATAIAALVQLRHLRAGNQINAMISIGEELSGKAFNDAQSLIARKLQAALDDPVYRDYEVALSRGQAPPEIGQEYVELRRATVLVGNDYEELGLLVKNGIVDKTLFLDAFAGRILGAWRRLENLTALAREASQHEAPWESFEYIAVLSEEWLRSHPSVYPKGVRRMRVQNPWPVQPLATPS